MPRKRQTQSGAPAQSYSSVPGQRYGEGVEQQQMQRTMPAPDNQAAMNGHTATPPPTPTEPPPMGTGPQNMDALMQLAQAMQGTQGSRFLPTANPNEPVTAGLSTGPGPGPEVLRNNPLNSPVGQFYRQLTLMTGDPYFAGLAERAGL